ncbi:MAG: hypothetical protein R6V47_01265 [Candidatus Delongbacteria bacterium]
MYLLSKGPAIFSVFVFACFLNGQFSSGTDYSVTTEEITGKTQFGAKAYTEKIDIEWDPVRTGDTSFNASSDMTAFGYGVFFNLPYDPFKISVSGDHKYADISNSASISDYSADNEDPVYTRLDVFSHRINRIGLDAELEYSDRYILSGRVMYLSTDDAKHSLQSGTGAEYRFLLQRTEYLGLLFEINSKNDHPLISELIYFTPVFPLQKFQILYSKVSDLSAFEANIRYMIYDKETIRDRKGGHIGTELKYSRYFKTAATGLNISAGSNLKNDLSPPEIFLPFLYYTLGLETGMSDGRLTMEAGWNYGFYKVYIKNRIETDGSAEIPSAADEVSEVTGKYHFYLKFGLNL